MSNKKVPIYKVLLLGNYSVGKTCFLLRYMDNTFETNHLTTVGLDYRLKSMKINTTHNFFKARKKPKNNLEMNKLLINSFGLNKINCNEFSKQLYNLNENYFSTMKKMKKEKAEMELRK